MATIRFELRKDKTDKYGLAPIRLVYQVSGQRKYFSTGVKVLAENWYDEQQQIIYVKKGALTNSEVNEANNKLADLQRDIEKIERKFEANGVVYSPDMVFDEQAQKAKPTRRDNSSKELYDFIDRYIADNELTRVPGSLSVYRSLKSHLQGYEGRTGKKITFDKIDYSFFQGFQNYLVGLTKKVDEKVTKALNNVTIAKQLSTLKTFLNYAKAQGIDVSNKYESFKIKRETDLEVIALTRREFDLLYNADFSNRPAWEQARDVFVFSCVTGLRYSDVNQLRREHIKDGYIDLTAIKTSHKTKVPLNPYSMAILKKYAKDYRPLPVISNQKTNEHLENICAFVGIDEPIEIVRKHGAQRVTNTYPKYELVRFHSGRKTFASLSLEAGMSAEYVMKIGGWKDYKSFKRYMNLTDDSTMGAMARAWGGKANKLKAV